MFMIVIMLVHIGSSLNPVRTTFTCSGFRQTSKPPVYASPLRKDCRGMTFGYLCTIMAVQLLKVMSCFPLHQFHAWCGSFLPNLSASPDTRKRHIPGPALAL